MVVRSKKSAFPTSILTTLTHEMWVTLTHLLSAESIVPQPGLQLALATGAKSTTAYFTVTMDHTV